MASYNSDPIYILDTTNATGVGSGGSLTLDGGAAINKDLYVGGNLSISGTTTSFSDNILILNQDASTSKDTGLLFKRYSSDITDNKNYSAMIYSETADEFAFGYLASDPENTSGTSFSNYIPLRADKLTLSNTTNAVDISNGGALTVGGGASIAKTLRVGNDIYITGNIYQNGNPLASESSIWIANNQNISYTSGNVSVNNFTSTSASVSNISITNISTGTISASGSSALQNVTSTNISSSTLVASTGITTGTLNATGSSTLQNVTSTNHTTGVLNATGITTGTLNVTTSITTGALSATNISTGTFRGSNMVLQQQGTTILLQGNNLRPGGLETVYNGIDFGCDIRLDCNNTFSNAPNYARGPHGATFVMSNIYDPFQWWVRGPGQTNANALMTMNSSGKITISDNFMTTAGVKDFLQFGQGDSTNNSGILDFNYITAGSSSNSIGLGFYSGNNKFVVRADGNVGIGTTNPSSRLHLHEATGILPGGNAGSIILSHGNTGGSSSITFLSANNSGSDYGFIQYIDSVANAGFTGYNYFGSSSGEAGALLLGSENDGNNASGPDSIIISPAGNVAITPRNNITYISGNVGIGTTNPASLLTLSGTSGNLLRFTTGSTTQSLFQGFYHGNGAQGLIGMDGTGYGNFNTGAFLMSTWTNNPIIFATNQIQRMTINTAGNVGIGTTSPGVALHVGSQATDANVRNTVAVFVPSKDITSRWLYLGWGDSNEARISSDTASKPITLSINDTERMRIASNGNVGIGTTNPGYTLDVNGTINLFGTSSGSTLRLNDNAIYLRSGSDTNHGLQFLSLIDGPRLFGFGGGHLGLSNTTTPSMAWNSGGVTVENRCTVKGGLNAQSNSNTIGNIYTTGGNVGVGTTNPLQTLHINTGNTIGGIIITGSGSNGRIDFSPAGSATIPAAASARILSIDNNWGADLLFQNRNTGSDNTTMNTRMTITAAGNVGIGTTNPSSLLTLSGNSGNLLRFTTGSTTQSIYQGFHQGNGAQGLIGIDGSGYGNFNTGAFLMSTWSNNPIIFATNQTQRMTINTAGNVGIGQTNPSVPLHVVGSSNMSFVPYGYLNVGGAGVSAGGGTNGYSIVASSRIAATEVHAYSDERIKTNIVDIDDASALSILRQIEPKRYTYVDVVEKGTQPVWGFIAQQVRSVLDYSTTTTKNFIPNIFEVGDVTNGNTITLPTKTTSNLSINQNIRIILENEIIETKITGIIDNSSFTVEQSIATNKAFVFGGEVDDFLTLNKDAIFTIATAAVQEIDRELETAKSTIATLQSDLQQAQSTIASMQSQIDAINQQLNGN